MKGLTRKTQAKIKDLGYIAPWHAEALAEARDMWKQRAQEASCRNTVLNNIIINTKDEMHQIQCQNRQLAEESILRGCALEQLRRALERHKIPPMTLLYDIIDAYTLRCDGKKWSEQFHRPIKTVRDSVRLK